MVGAFHMPKLVYTNVSVLRTLPDDQLLRRHGRGHQARPDPR
ncbi:MAG: hypothetical protein ACLUAR_02435 [Pilosibacter sp.]